MLPRERFAWAWLTGLVIIPTLYFIAAANLVPPAGAGASILQRLGLLGAALTALALVALAGRFLAGGRPQGPRAVLTDERDTHIESRAAAVAYHVLMGGMIVVGCVMPFSAGTWDLVHAALLAIVLAEVVHYGLVLRAYRTGAV